MRVSGPLVQCRERGRVAMGARVWQSWIRGLATAWAPSKAPESSQFLARTKLNDWLVSDCLLSKSSRTGVLLRWGSFRQEANSRVAILETICGGAASRISNGKFFKPGGLTGSIVHTGSERSSKYASMSSGIALKAMQLSTLSVEEQNADQSASSEHLSPTSVHDQEFVPETVDTPSTPLVEAILSQEQELLEFQGSISGGGESGAVDSPRSEFGSLDEVIDGGSPSTSHEDRVVEPGRVFVGGLPFAIKGDELKEALHNLFGNYGTVQDIQLSLHRNQSRKSVDAGKHRGFAFVSMGSPEEASAVIDKLNGETLWGRSITVSFGLKRVEPDLSARERNVKNVARLARCKVFVGNLHESTSLETLKTKFSQYGTIVDAKLITELASSKSRGFGFMTFSDEAEAMKAILDLDGSILDGSSIRVNIAKYPQSM